MIPRLAARGRWIVVAALVFLLVGALRTSPPLVGLAGAILAALLAAYLVFYPTAILLRRKKIELSWWVPPGDQPGGALAATRGFDLHVAFRNHGSRALRILHSRVFASDGLEVGGDGTAKVAAGQQVEITMAVRPLRSGHLVFHGAALRLGDLFGLFEVEAYFPNPVAVKVFPRARNAQVRALRPLGASLHEKIGLHHVRRRGHAGELREVREHAPGDPFKFIAWKATARRGKLMVRDLESEIVATSMLVFDVGASMRAGQSGRRPLDWAIETGAALAREAALGGDRIGVCAFDTRVVGELAPGNGHHHWLQLVDRLLDAHSLVDEDLTDITPGELVAVVAKYLAHQEAIDVRMVHAPPLDDPRWASIQAGPDGQLYDLAAMGKAVRTLIDVAQRERGRALAPSAWWQRLALSKGSDPFHAPLRLFCRLRGLELPYRPLWEHGRRSLGLVAALDRIAEFGRCDGVLLLTDGVGLAEREPEVARALAKLRRRTRAITALVPAPERFVPEARGSHAAAVRAVAVADLRASARAGLALLKQHRVRVVSAGPDDAPAALLTRAA